MRIDYKVLSLLLVLGIGAILMGGVMVDTQPPQETYQGVIDESDRGDVVELVVRFDEPNSVGSVEERKHVADNRQDAFHEWANARDGVNVKESFWLSSAILVEVDTTEVPLQSLTNRPYVNDVHENYTFELDSAAQQSTPPVRSNLATETTTEDNDYTYGLEQIQAPTVWDTYGTRGEGITISILDTGINPDHEAIDLYTDDAEDPSYPGGWAEFDRYGHRIDSEPYDDHGHGTHVSGTAGGGAVDGKEQIGVAPESNLTHGKVFYEDDDGNWGATWSQVTAGLEWSVENDTDVVSMSLGSNKDDGKIDTLENTREHGVVVLASAGNDGEGTASSPGAEWSVIGIGASDAETDIADFSAGKELNRDDWDSPPEYWPEPWFAPTVVAPGVGIQSADASTIDEYSSSNGTSMAAPHVAGAVALIQSATEEDHREIDIREALRETAWKPDDWDESEAEWYDDERDSRYGYGIIDTYSAIEYLEANDDRLVVTDTDIENEPMRDADTSVNVTVENTYDGEKEKAIELYVDDTLEHTATETVDPGEHTFEYTHVFEDSGEHDVRINTYLPETVDVQNDTDIKITVDTPEEYTNSDPVRFEGTASSEYADTESVEVHVDDTGHVATLDGDDWHVDVELDEGTYEAYILVENSHSYSDSDTIEFTVDRTEPDVDVTNPTEVEPTTATTSETVTVELTHDEENLDTVMVDLVDDEDTVIDTATVDTPDMEFALDLILDDEFDHVHDDTYDIVVTAVDEADNEAVETEAGAVIVDHDPPTIDVLDVDDEYVQPGEEITITAGGEYAGVIEGVTADSTILDSIESDDYDYLYRGDITAEDTEGEHEVTVTVDPEGDDPVTDTLTYVVDDTDPEIEDVTLPESVEQGTEYDAAVTATDDNSGVGTVTVDGYDLKKSDDGDTWSGTAVAPDEPGDHEATITVADNAGNTAETTEVIEVVESIDLDVDDLDDYTNNGFIAVTGSFANHDAPVEVQVDGPADTVVEVIDEGDTFDVDIELEEGENELVVTAEDENDTSDSQTVVVTKDTDAPNIDISAPNEVDEETDTATVSGTVTDDQSGVDDVTLYVNDGDGMSVAAEFEEEVDLEYGENTVEVVATDDAGNEAIETTTIDREKPDLELGVDDLPDETSSETITVSGEIDGAIDGAVIEITSSIDTAERTLEDESGTFEADLELEEGENTVQVEVTDGDGRTETEDQTVTSDQTPPDIITIETPDEVEQGSDFTVNVDVTDELTGVDTVHANDTTLSHDGGETWTGTLTAPEESGEYTVTITAEDGVGNTADDSTTVDVAKDLVLDVDEVPDETEDETVEVSGTVEDYYETATVTIDSETDTVEQTLTDGETMFEQTVDLEEGENTITIDVLDEEGQTASHSLTVERVEADDDDEDDDDGGGGGGGGGFGGDGGDDDNGDEDDADDDETDSEDDSEEESDDSDDEEETENETPDTLTVSEYYNMPHVPFIDNPFFRFELVVDDDGDLFDLLR